MAVMKIWGRQFKCKVLFISIFYLYFTLLSRDCFSPLKF